MPIASMTTSIIGMLRAKNFPAGSGCLMAEGGLELSQERSKKLPPFHRH
jgi:hypothetical protein